MSVKDNILGIKKGNTSRENKMRGCKNVWRFCFIVNNETPSSCINVW